MSKPSRAVIAAHILLTFVVAACGRSDRSAGREEAAPQSSVATIALFGVGAERGCAMIQLYRNAIAGRERGLPRRACVDSIVAFHARVLTDRDRVSFERFQRSRAFERLRAFLLMDEEERNRTLPGICSEEELDLLRRIGTHAVATLANPDGGSNPEQPPLGDSYFDGLITESLVLSASPLCDTMTTAELRQLAELVRSEAASHMTLAARQSLEWAFDVR